MSAALALALDLGTTRVKLARLDAGGALELLHSAEAPAPGGAGALRESDPEPGQRGRPRKFARLTSEGEAGTRHSAQMLTRMIEGLAFAGEWKVESLAISAHPAAVPCRHAQDEREVGHIAIDDRACTDEGMATDRCPTHDRAVCAQRGAAAYQSSAIFLFAGDG